MNDNILGCFFKIGFDPELNEQDFINLANTFKSYLWSDKGICDKLRKLKYIDYGNDLKLALFQFYVKPTTNELQKLRDIESYRKNEKSIGIPIIINDENFFSKSEEERYCFLKKSIFHKLDLLAEIVKRKKLDTKMDLLIADLKELLDRK